LPAFARQQTLSGRENRAIAFLLAAQGDAAGAGASAAISNIYYPQENRTMSANLSRWGSWWEKTLFSTC
jgi:hypothetical protein